MATGFRAAASSSARASCRPWLAADAGGHAVRNRRDRLRGFRLRPGPWLLPQGQRGVSSAGCGPIGQGNRITLNGNGHSILFVVSADDEENFSDKRITRVPNGEKNHG